MVTAVYYGITANRKLLDDKYLSLIMTNILLKISPKSEQCFLATVGTGVLNYDTFFDCEEFQNCGKSFYDKRTRDYRIYCLKMAVASSC